MEYNEEVIFHCICIENALPNTGHNQRNKYWSILFKAKEVQAINSKQKVLKKSAEDILQKTLTEIILTGNNWQQKSSKRNLSSQLSNNFNIGQWPIVVYSDIDNFYTAEKRKSFLRIKNIESLHPIAANYY